jgi:hypothetical protein
LVDVHVFTTGTQEEYPAAFAAMREAGMEGLWIDATPQFAADYAQILALALEARLPTVCAYPEVVPVGCMMSYGQNLPAPPACGGLCRPHPARRVPRRNAHRAAHPVLGGGKSPHRAHTGPDLPQTLVDLADEVIE